MKTRSTTADSTEFSLIHQLNEQFHSISYHNLKCHMQRRSRKEIGDSQTREFHGAWIEKEWTPLNKESFVCGRARHTEYVTYTPWLPLSIYLLITGKRLSMATKPLLNVRSTGRQQLHNWACLKQSDFFLKKRTHVRLVLSLRHSEFMLRLRNYWNNFNGILT
jgi:hypothetical protein